MGVLADWQIELEKCVHPFSRTQSVEGRLTSGVSHYGYDVTCSPEFQIFTPVVAGGVIDPKNFNPKLLVSDPELTTLNGAVIIPPNSFALTQTVERLEIPRSVICTVLGKSTYARCGVICNVTPLEPEWRGRITIELSNTASLPVKIYPNEGIAQVLFHRADGPLQVLLDDLVERLTDLYDEAMVAGALPDATRLPRRYEAEARKKAEDEVHRRVYLKLCQKSYADKKGRYQDQGSKVVLPSAVGSAPRQVDGMPGTGHPTG